MVNSLQSENAGSLIALPIGFIAAIFPPAIMSITSAGIIFASIRNTSKPCRRELIISDESTGKVKKTSANAGTPSPLKTLGITGAVATVESARHYMNKIADYSGK